jgi:hypothetical protein
MRRSWFLRRWGKNGNRSGDISDLACQCAAMIRLGPAAAGPAMHRSIFVNGNALDEIPA